MTAASVVNRWRPCNTPHSAPKTGNAVSATGRTSAGPTPRRCSSATSAGAAASDTTPTSAPRPTPSPTADRRSAPVPAMWSVTPVCTLIAGTMPTTSTAIRADNSPNEDGTRRRAATMVKA